MEMLTKAEKDSIEARLRALVANRPVVSQRIAEARELGDLRENGDYHAAREQQGMEEAEIRRLTERLAGASLINEQQKSLGVVFIGSMVTIREQGTDEREKIKIVGDPSGTIADDYMEVTASSPMGDAMMKASVGDVVTVRTPRGPKKFEILSIE
jgi:transcription elongation factor GreA